MPVVPLPNIIKNTTQAAAEMIGHLGPRQTSSRGGLPTSSGAPAPPAVVAPLPQRTNSLRSDREGSRRGQTPPVSQPPREEKYVVYIRLPFERGGFADPPQVDWDDAKERYLWKLLSRAGRSTDLDWNVVATHLQVSRAFLLQQAAWLYERELSQIQAQMRRAGTSALNTNIANIANSPSSRPQSPAVMGGIPMARTGTAGIEPWVHSSPSGRPTPIATPRPTPRPTPGLPATPTRPSAQPMSRTGSSATTRGAAQPLPTIHRFSAHTSAEPNPNPPPERPLSASEDYTESSITSTSSDDEDGGRLVRKLPSFLNKRVAGESSDEDDGDEQPTFLPFSQGDKSVTGADDPMTGTITLRRRTSGADTIKGKEVVRPGSRPGADPSSESPARIRRSRNQSALESPRRLPVDSTGLSTGPNSPSMESSFSDLSDTSVTQSAMEEAYLQAGGVASRMSSLSQAVRSRYFPPN